MKFNFVRNDGFYAIKVPAFSAVEVAVDRFDNLRG